MSGVCFYNARQIFVCPQCKGSGALTQLPLTPSLQQEQECRYCKGKRFVLVNGDDLEKKP